MSLMGYAEQDILSMMASINIAKDFYFKYPSDLINKQPVLNGLQNAYDFLDGLLVEGRI